MACFRSHNSVQPGLFSAGVSTMLPRRLKLASQPSDVLKAKKGYLRAMFLLCSRSRQRSNKLEFNSSTMTRRAASGFGWQRKSESGDRRLWLEDGPACAGASSGCLNLTVPLAATFGLKMLKRPTLHFSARRHRAQEATTSTRPPLATWFAQCFLRLSNLDPTLLDRVGSYEARLWRQAAQTIWTLDAMRRPPPAPRRRPFRKPAVLPYWDAEGSRVG